MALVFDIETDGLLEELTQIHCLIIQDTETGEHWKCFAGGNKAGCFDIEDGLFQLEKHPGLIIGHNIIKFDLPAIQKLYPSFTYDRLKVFDTLVATRLIYSNVKDIDSKLLKKGTLPGNLFGSHSLEAWGHRLGEHKGEYKDWFKENCKANGIPYKSGDEWKVFSQEMLDYCVQDVVVSTKLYETLNNHKVPIHEWQGSKWVKTGEEPYSQEALHLEHSIAFLMAKQEANGFQFNEQKAGSLYGELAQKRGDLERECRKLFDPWEVRLADFIPKRDNKTLGYKAGIPVKKYKTVVFNPSSRDHIANRLQVLYGWKPTEFTDGGKPKVDEDVLKHLSYPPAKILTEYLLVQKRLSQLAEGKQAWLKCVKKGKIHGSVNPNGAVTGRATHSHPNISQVPAGNAPYGKACRELFEVPEGWVLMGADASGLELRCLAHYMANWDKGAYALVLLSGDIHTENRKAAGLPTRDNAKTFIYGFLYGAGDAKIGSIVNGDSSIGRALRGKFLRSLPALGKLSEHVKRAAKRGYIVGLDRRRVHVRSSHSALNTLLQSAGALVCKKWLEILFFKTLTQSSLKHGWDGDFVLCAWSHDEIQVACRTPEIAEDIGRMAREAVTEAGEHFKFRCRLDGESKIGRNWAETH